jgi:hypothetical protein
VYQCYQEVNRLEIHGTNGLKAHLAYRGSNALSRLHLCACERVECVIPERSLSISESPPSSLPRPPITLATCMELSCHVSRIWAVDYYNFRSTSKLAVSPTYHIVLHTTRCVYSEITRKKKREIEY